VGAKIEVNHPPAFDFLKINSVTLVPEPAQQGLTVTQIAPAEEIKVAWPHRRKGSPNGLTVDTLLQLYVDPASARLDVDLRLTGDAAGIETLELATPPQLKLLPIPDGSPVAEAQSIPGLPGITVLKLQGPLPSNRVVRLRFQVQRSVSLGNINYPIVRAAGVTPGATHLAVFVDPSLRLRDESTTNLSVLPLAELEGAWWKFDTSPVAQFAAAGAEPAWIMQVEPAPQQFTARESIELLCSANDARVTYAAAVEAVQGDVLLHRLAVPADLEVTAVTVASNDAQAMLRWSRPRPDQLVVFLARPLKAAHRLRLTGRLMHNGRDFPVPRIGFEGESAGPINVDVVRTSDVVVEWSDGVKVPLPVTDSPQSAGGLLVGRYSVDREATNMPALRILPNEARISADVLLSMNLEAGEPVATAAIHLRALRGVVDRVRLEIGNNWLGPLSTDSGHSVVSISTPSDSRTQFIEFHLAKPLAAGQETLLRFFGAVALDGDQRLRFPHVRLLNATEQRVFLCLPKTPRDQTAEWTLRGVQLAELPNALNNALGASGSSATYRISHERFVAEQRVFPLALRAATVRLAATQVTLDGVGNWSAISQLVVQPGGAGGIQLELPQGMELLHAAVDERPIPLAPTRRQRLQLPTGSRYLPQVVSIAYRSSQNSFRRIKLEVPHVLVNGKRIAVARSLWGLEGQPGAGFVIEGTGAALSSVAFEAECHRELLAAVLEASPLAFQLPEWERNEWLKPWIRRVDVTSTMGLASADKLQEAAWTKLKERVDVADETGGSAAALQHGADLTTAWYRGGPDGTLTLVRRRAGIGAGRWLLALAIVGTGIVAWRSPERVPPVVATLRRWPAALGVAAGFLWWLWLTPSLLGLAIVALSLAAFIKARQLRLYESPDARVPVDHSASTALAR
jgi:hypothetical protein